MAGLEFKSYRFELKDISTDGDGRTRFNGYASVFGNEDSYGDIIEPGAFRKTLSENAGRVKVLWQHDPWTPIGKPTTMREDAVGLYTEAELSRTQAAKDAGILLDDKVIDELSIGFTPIKYAMREGAKQSGGRSLQEIRLWEYSLVTWAANDLATITGVKDALGILRKGHAVAASMRDGDGSGLPANMKDVLDQLRTLTADLEALLPSSGAAKGHSDSGVEPPTDEPVDPNVLTLAAEIRSLVTPTHTGG